MSTTVDDTVATEQLGRIQYMEPDPSSNPMERGYLDLPPIKALTYQVHPLHDIRTEISQDPSPYTLQTHAFTVVKHKSIMHTVPNSKESFFSPSIVEELYIPEVISLVKTVTGAAKVFVISSTVRCKERNPPPKTTPELANTEPETPRQRMDMEKAKLDLNKPRIDDPRKFRHGPAPSAHLDYTPAGARSLIRNKSPDIVAEVQDIIQAEDEALATGKEYTGRRYAFYSIWRPLKKVTRDPLAVCDPNVLKPGDLVGWQNKQAGVKGDFLVGVYFLSQYASQKWLWIKEQKEDEVYFLQFYDNYAEKEGRPIGVPHVSPELLGVEAESRESSETRLLAVWD